MSRTLSPQCCKRPARTEGPRSWNAANQSLVHLRCAPPLEAPSKSETSLNQGQKRAAGEHGDTRHSEQDEPPADMQRGCGLTVGTRSGGAEGGRVLPRAKDVTTLLVRGTLHMACYHAPLTEWPPSECSRAKLPWQRADSVSPPESDQDRPADCRQGFRRVSARIPTGYRRAMLSHMEPSPWAPSPMEEVVVVQRPRGVTDRRLICQAAASLLILASVVLLRVTSWSGRDSAAHAAPGHADLLQTDLRLRSAALVVRDLAAQYDLANFKKEPFSFCGKAHITLRQAKLCAEYFLSAKRDRLGVGEPGERRQSTTLFGFPQLAAYNKCMDAPTSYMIKACIREVTRALTPDELVHQTRTGSTGHDKGLEEVGMHAIETAQPDQAVAGLNGGMNGEAAEMSSAKFLAKVDEAGDVSKVTEEAVPDATGWTPEKGCIDLGLGGCDSPHMGGLKPKLKEWALALQKERAPPPEA